MAKQEWGSNAYFVSNSPIRAAYGHPTIFVGFSAAHIFVGSGVSGFSSFLVKRSIPLLAIWLAGYCL